jgi:iron complex transport system ATP-binding protein
LRAVELSIEGGQCWFLLGPNGAGKSTLLAMLAGVVRPLAGQVELDGRPIDRWPAAGRARRLSLLPQLEAGLFEGTVHEFVALGRFPWRRRPGPAGRRGVPGWPDCADADDAAIVAAELAAFELGPLAGRPFEQLSGGERQRARLAQAFAQRAALMLLDEPFTHLDLRHQVALTARLRAHCAGGEGAVFAVVHEFGWTIDAADRVAFAFADGRFEAGPAADLLVPGRLSALLGCRFVEAGAGDRRIWLPQP